MEAQPTTGADTRTIKWANILEQIAAKEREAAQGRPSAQYFLKVIHERHMHKDLDHWEHGFTRLEAELDTENRMVDSSEIIEPGLAACMLGLVYEYGIGVDTSKGRAMSFYERASDVGNSVAQGILAWLLDGEDNSDQQKVIRLYTAAAAKGNVAALCNLGWMYLDGKGLKRDVAKGLELFQRAAEQGYVHAFYSLGRLYDEEPAYLDMKKGAEYITKSAEMGYDQALLRLGMMYEEGHGVAHDIQKAIECYEKAAALGNTDALCTLGVVYERGDTGAVDEQKAFEYYGKAAALGNPQAMCNLGMMYANGGAGLQMDVDKALQLYQTAADMGELVGYFNIGLLYYHGPRKNKKKAKEYFLLGAEKGDPMCQAQMGFMLERGDKSDDGQRREPDLRGAVEWYHKAAQQADESGAAFMGGLYMDGRIVSNDEAHGTQWLRVAALAGNADVAAYLLTNDPFARKLVPDEAGFLDAVDSFPEHLKQLYARISH